MNTVADDDFFEAGEVQLRHPELKAKVEMALKLQAEAAEAEALAASAKSDLNKLLLNEIPALMQELGTEIYRDPATGAEIELDVAINASLPKTIDKRNAIIDGLRPLGVEDILREEYTVAFTPGDARSAVIRRLLMPGEESLIESNEVADRVEQLREELGIGLDLPSELKTGVHPSTFRSWLKQQIEAGHGVEVSDAGIWHGSIAKIKMPKGKK